MLYHVIPSTVFYTMWYLQTALCHVMHSICFISCDTFIRLYNMIHSNMFYILWYLKTAIYHVIPSNWLYLVIHSNFVMPYDTLKMLSTMWYRQTVYTMWYLQIVLTMWYLQQTFVYSMWYFQSVLYHVILSICVIPRDTFNLFYITQYLQTVYTMWYFQSVLYHVMYSNCFIPCDTFNLFYITW